MKIVGVAQHMNLKPFATSRHFGSKPVITVKEIVKCCMTIYVHVFILLSFSRTSI